MDIHIWVIFEYLKGLGYPFYINTKNEKYNFRRQSKTFFAKGNFLYHKTQGVKVVFDVEKS